MSRPVSPGTRRHRRLTLRVPVVLRRVDDGTALDTHATTLGAGGLFVPTERPLARGTALLVRLRLPGSREEHVLRAEVAWASAPTTPGVAATGHGMGIAFRDPAGIAQLAEALARLAPEVYPAD
jgi:Tfp pilus assembly protein PilZ